jgi:hypothetical protein
MSVFEVCRKRGELTAHGFRSSPSSCAAAFVVNRFRSRSRSTSSRDNSIAHQPNRHPQHPQEIPEVVSSVIGRGVTFSSGAYKICVG